MKHAQVIQDHDQQELQTLLVQTDPMTVITFRGGSDLAISRLITANVFIFDIPAETIEVWYELHAQRDVLNPHLVTFVLRTASTTSLSEGLPSGTRISMQIEHFTQALAFDSEGVATFCVHEDIVVNPKSKLIRTPISLVLEILESDSK